MLRQTLETMPSTTNPVDFIGGLFPKRQLSIIASEPGCGKTWVMLKFCANISNGFYYNKFFGTRFVERDRKSLMLVGDTGKEMILDRVNHMDIIKYVKSPNYVFYFVADMIKEKHPFLLNTVEGRGAIQGLIHAEKPDIVFFDTLISFITADENSAKEIGEVFIGLREMAEEENCAIVLNHHFRKTNAGILKRGKASLNDVIGSSAMSRLASVMIAMTRDRTIPERNIVDIFTVKTWYKEMQPLKFEISSDREGKISIIPDYGARNVMGARKILNVLANDLPDGEIISVNDIQEVTYIPRDTLIAALEKSPFFTKLNEAGERYYVTPEYIET